MIRPREYRGIEETVGNRGRNERTADRLCPGEIPVSVGRNLALVDAALVGAVGKDLYRTMGAIGGDPAYGATRPGGDDGRLDAAVGSAIQADAGTGSGALS